MKHNNLESRKHKGKRQPDSALHEPPRHDFPRTSGSNKEGQCCPFRPRSASHAGACVWKTIHEENGSDDVKNWKDKDFIPFPCIFLNLYSYLCTNKLENNIPVGQPDGNDKKSDDTDETV